MIQQPCNRPPATPRRLGVALAATGWGLALVGWGLALVRPGFGIRGSAPPPRPPSVNAPSASAAGSGAGPSRSNGSVRLGAPRVQPGFGRNPHSGGSSSSRPGFDVRGGGAPPRGPSVSVPRGDKGPSRSGGSGRLGTPRVQPGFGRNPYYGGGSTSRPGGSRDRFFRPGSSAGSYGYGGGYRRRRDRVYYYYTPFLYGVPIYSPFLFGYSPYGSIFSYYDWYTSPYRPYSEQAPYAWGRGAGEEVDQWPLRGNVQLDIQPRDVEVRIDSVLTTQDGRASLDLPTGTYQVEVSRPGYRTWTTELVVRHGIRYRIEPRLERLPGEEAREERGPTPRLAGELQLDVTPDDAVATLDGRLLGVVKLLQGSAALHSIPVGRHTLELSRPGYRTVTRKITVDAREPLKLIVRLERE